jgi:hypothetical protein
MIEMRQRECEEREEDDGGVFGRGEEEAGKEVGVFGLRSVGSSRRS